MWDCFLCGYRNPDDTAVFCAGCGNRRSFIRTNYRQFGVSAGTISYALSTTASNTTSGNYSIWLYEDLKRKGYPDEEIALLRENVEEVKQQQPILWEAIENKLKQGDSATLAYAKEIQRRSRASEIVNQMSLANDLFQDRRKAKLFRLDKAEILERLHHPSFNADDFAAKIASLASLFEVPLDPLRALIPNSLSEWKSITLVEKTLESEKIPFDPDMIKVWQNVIALRNAIPLHPRILL